MCTPNLHLSVYGHLVVRLCTQIGTAVKRTHAGGYCVKSCDCGLEMIYRWVEDGYICGKIVSFVALLQRDERKEGYSDQLSFTKSSV